MERLLNVSEVSSADGGSTVRSSDGAEASSNPYTRMEHEGGPEVALLCDLLDDAHNHFDASVYLACNQYVDRHETDERMTLQVQSEEPMEREQWTFLNVMEKFTVGFEQPLRSGFGKTMLGIQVLIVLFSSFAVVMESLHQYNPSIYPEQLEAWDTIEGCVATYLILELSLRALCYPSPKNRFVLRFSNMLDLCSVVPFFVRLGTTQTTTWGMLKALRLVRVAKFLRYGKTFQQVIFTMRKSVPALTASTGLFLLFLMVLSSALFHAERGYWDEKNHEFMAPDCLCETSAEFILGRKQCPAKVSQFYSVTQAAWFLVSTMTTVGYGDIVPQCSTGMLIAIAGMVFGTFFLAMPVGIVGAYYSLIVLQSQSTIDRLNAKAKCDAESEEERKKDKRNRNGRKRRGKNDKFYFRDSGEDENTLSPGERLLSFLRTNLNPAELSKVQFSATTPGLHFYLNMYLLDFVEELARMPDDIIGAPAQVAVLKPCFHSVVTKVFQFNEEKRETKFDIRLFEDQLQEFQSQIQQLLPSLPQPDSGEGRTRDEVVREWAAVHERMKQSGPNAVPTPSSIIKDTMYLSPIGLLVPRTPEGKIVRYFHRLAGVLFIRPPSRGKPGSEGQDVVSMRIADAESLQDPGRIISSGEDVTPPLGWSVSTSTSNAESKLGHRSKTFFQQDHKWRAGWNKENRVSSSNDLRDLLHCGRFNRSDQTSARLGESLFSVEKPLYNRASVEVVLPSRLQDVSSGNRIPSTNSGFPERNELGRRVTLTYREDDQDLETAMRSFHSALEVEKAQFNPLLVAPHTRASTSLEGGVREVPSGFDTSRTYRSFFNTDTEPVPQSTGRNFVRGGRRRRRIMEDESGRLERLISVQDPQVVDATISSSQGHRKPFAKRTDERERRPGDPRQGHGHLYKSSIPPGGHR